MYVRHDAVTLIRDAIHAQNWHRAKLRSGHAFQRLPDVGVELELLKDEIFSRCVQWRRVGTCPFDASDFSLWAST